VNLSLHIARRYLFAKKSHNAINIISIISVCGIAVATLAMVCALSIFNGFTQLAADSFSLLDPDLKIIPAQGKVFDPNASDIQEVKKLEEIETASESIEENALARYNDRQEPVLIKGVDDNFPEMVDLDRLLLTGQLELRSGDVDFSAAGIGLAGKLGIRIDNIVPLEIFAPKRDVLVNMANPSASFTQVYTYPESIFALHQSKYDDQLVIVSMDLARYLFRYDSEISALNIRLKDGASAASVKKKIQDTLGSSYLVQDRFEQQSDAFQMVSIEKWVTYLILVFILTIAAFNLVGSLSMLIIDKRADINILRNMGADNNLISRIFLFEGWLISFTGVIIGLVAGVTICLMQMHFGLLKLGQSPGAFIIDAYPVKIIPSDLLFIFATVCVISFLIILYPVNNLRKKLKNS